MKWVLFCYSAIAFSLLGCQQLLSTPAPEPELQQYSVQTTSELEKNVKYGVIFASEYMLSEKETCAKYKQLYLQGDWRAGWVLALHVDNTNTQSCLKLGEALRILTSLEAENKINPDLVWLSQYHLQLLYKQQQQIKKISRLRASVSRYKQQINDLTEDNKSQLEKLEALKAIETSIINNDLNNEPE